MMDEIDDMIKDAKYFFEENIDIIKVLKEKLAQ